jgi:LPXTG-site transpeptidase (sortase) family protein
MFVRSRRVLYSLLILALLLTSLGASHSDAKAAATVFINEIHYDNASTDVGEAVEIAGPAGTDLTGWSVVLYNGNGGASYGTTNLSGTIPNQQNGYGTLTFAIAGLQNGAPDGLALVDASSNVVQFLSYEGSFAAVGGPADGLTSTDIGVAETTSTAVGDSLQLTGTGTSYDDFTWSGPAASSFGAVNTGQIFPVSAPTFIINEVDSDTPSTDVAEFVELYDGGVGNASLNGLALVFFNGSNDLSYYSLDLDGYSTDADGYFVICGDAANVANCDLDTTPDSNLIQNGADAIALYTGDGTDFPTGTAITTTNLLDAIVYDTNDSDDAGLLVLLNAGQPQVNEGSTDSAADSNQRCPDGTGGQRNTVSYAQYAPTAGTANTCFSAAIDLELTKTVDDSNPMEGETLTYTLTVSNVSTTQDATNVVVRDYLPDTTTQLTNVTPGTCSQGTMTSVAANTLEWTVGGLAASGSATCTISADVRTGTDGTSFNNYAEVYSVTETTDGDSASGNFSASPAEDDEAGALVTVGLPPVCGTAATLISAIQGSGTASPENGNTHTIEGVVVGDFQTSTYLRGFFLQEEDADADADPATSEGIFVYDGSTPAVDVVVGDVVRVTGTITEYYDLTEMTSVSSVIACGTGNATAASVTLPVTSLDVWERYEGMLVNIPQTLYATENYNTGRYGEVELSVGGRLNNPTNVVAPGTAAIALQDLNDRSRIQMEDGRTVQNPDPAPYVGLDNTLRAGDTLPGLTGVLNYSYGAYEIHPTGTITFTRANPRPATPPNVGGTVKVVGMNALNYFSTIDTGSPICGPASNQDCRGADSAAEFTRQRDKIINEIVAMDADVIGLMEIENHPTDAALQDLVNGVNAVAGAGTYAAVSTGPIGTDAIKVAFIYKTATITPVGGYAILDSSVDSTFIDTKNRPSLAQTFAEIATGRKFTVAVNHLKSKGSDCNSLGDPDTGDGQGNCNLTRTSAATALVNWLATDPTGSGDPDFLIIGDLNSYAKEDPITAITSAGYINLVNAFLGANGYSYVFGGQKGYLDHALANAAMYSQVTGVTEWHINADEPSALDYNDYNQAALYTPAFYRSADHDPVIIGLSLGTAPTVLLNAHTNPVNGAALLTGPTQIMVEFSKDVKHDGSPEAANNLINYLLLESQGDGFQTASCASAAASGVDPADTQILINSAMYQNTNGFTATLGINNGIPLPAGTYRLYVCGTTSIEDMDGLKLNGGLSDAITNFTVGVAKVLPQTGFPQGIATTLPNQPENMAYTETAMLLEIPSLGVSMPIVGVPLTANGWDVTWLGNAAGYLAGSAFPTWNGNTVLTGHVWDASNQPGPFARVKELKYGDRIQIKAWGMTYVYEIRETLLVSPKQVKTVMQKEDFDWITLVTCEDYQSEGQSYSFRRAVRAVLVEVK